MNKSVFDFARLVIAMQQPVALMERHLKSQQFFSKPCCGIVIMMQMDLHITETCLAELR